MDQNGALNGVRVLDASQMLAGPIAGMRLGDLGADVVKIEPPGTGEYNRTHGFGDLAVGGVMTTFLGLNRNKRSAAINLKHPAGRQALHDLVRASDVFIQNFRVGTAERLGAGYAELSAINPRLVYCSISGYGEQGPYADRPGQDLIIQGYSGSMWSVGSHDDPPIPGALWSADAMTGYQAVIAVLAALISRATTGAGQKVEVSMLSVVMDCQSQELATYLNLGILPQRTLTSAAHPWIPAPYGVFRTSDSYVTLAMSPLPRLGAALGDDRWNHMTDTSDGMKHRDEVQQVVAAHLITRTTDEWLDVFDRCRLWAGRIYDYAQLASDPHVVETGMIVSVEHPTAGVVRLPNVPIRMSGTPPGIRLPPPELGQHTQEVLREAGYDDQRLAQLAGIGAIG